MAVKKPTAKSEGLLFPKLDKYFDKRLNLFFYLSMALMTLFSILLFDIRISEGGDDSEYLLNAKKFVEGESFPGFHGALYSMFIGLFIKLVGFKLGLFKVLSIVSLLAGQALLFYSLRTRISSFLLASVLLIASLSSGLIYFGSQTYTEAFYLMLQGLFFLIFFKYIADRPNELKDIKSSWGLYVALSASMFMLATTRNVGIVSLLAVIFFFFVEKRFYQALFAFITYLPFNFGYGLYKKLVWNITESDMSGQMQLVMQKHPYNKALGTEDMSGMVTRVVENLKNFLSKVLMHETGLKSADNKDTSLFLAILIVLVLLVGLVLAFRNKDRVLKFILVYLGMSLGVTFIALHQMWSQARLIIVYIPLIILGVSWTLAQLAKFKKVRALRIVAIALLAIIALKSFTITVGKAKAHQETLTKNLSGNRYYGYTPDWINFLKMSEWVSKNVDEEIMVISRKPSMSFIYGNGREFYPMYRIPVEYADSVLIKAKASGKTALVIKENDLKGKASSVIYQLKPNMDAAISADNVLYSIYLYDEEQIPQVISMLESAGLTSILRIDEFEALLAKAKETTAIIPDKMIQKLLDNNVEYAIVGSLRVNPKQKTNRTINTVARYLAGVQLKYPGILTQVQQVGRNDMEPARLYKIEYARYGLK